MTALPLRNIITITIKLTTMKKVTTLAEATELSTNLCNDYHKNRLMKAVELAKQIEVFYPCYVEADINGDYLEWVYIYLHHESLKITIQYDEYRKKYNLCCFWTRLFPNLSGYQISDVEKQFTAPNKIGVLNTKKITDWVNYYEAIYTQLKEKNNENKSKIQEFRDKIADLPIHWYDNNRGYMEKNGIRYEFTIDNQGGYVNERMSITKSSNLENFLKITN